MLTLQRASAGSGKTYTLTKKYVRLLISIPTTDDGQSPRRLRTAGELTDSVQHILAVTFTNKATNEMKERILSALNSLGYPKGDPMKVAYMKDFTEEFHASTEDVSEICREALVQVLYNYSEFNISTIDAFFQTILRTFAYESDLPDSYQLVIDSDYPARLAAKELIDDLAGGRLQSEEKNWVTQLVKKEIDGGKNGWKVFQRNEEINKSNSKSTFKDICAMARSLENEQYKAVRESLDNYFGRFPIEVKKGDGEIATELHNLIEVSDYIDSKVIGPVERAFAMMVNCAKNVVEAYDELASNPVVYTANGASSPIKGSDIIYNGRTINSQLSKILDANADPCGDYKFTLPGDISNGKKFFKGGVKGIKGIEDVVVSPVLALAEAVEEWKKSVQNEDFVFWMIAREGMPRLALMRNLRDRISTYLMENDAMQLADTNTILHKIINQDDVPFIYERIGTRILHFLIDEFQDTSRMQWDNFYPLLAESVGNNNENLIIGDAKQSIYRFRNAEPKLITTIVPSKFAGSIEARGYSEADNSNWRSKRRIVKFNNVCFHMLSRALDDLNCNKFEIITDSENEQEATVSGIVESEKLIVKTDSMAELYSNTVQMPRSEGEEGYVEVKFFKKGSNGSEGSGSGEDDEQKGGGKVQPEIMKEISSRIVTLLRRGYGQRHIAILVNSKAVGEEIIAGLMAFSAGRDYPADLAPLQFVSEDSLKLGRSEAVNTIVEYFKMIQSKIEGDDGNAKLRGLQRGSSSEDASGDDDAPIGNRRVNWHTISHKFMRFASRYPDLTLPEKFNKFRNEDVKEPELEEMIAGMQAVTLPSLVEALVEMFVPEEQQRKEAPFIAAFQDAVLEYCDAHPTDIGSMLRWWDRAGRNIAISSPEGTEAINVMTIHKSKGLEFPCVILPELNLNFEMRDEWVWLATPGAMNYSRLLPSSLPVMVTSKRAKNLKEGEYFDKYCEMQYMHEVDMINKAYVAMTRAENELYIYLQAPGKQKKGSNLQEIVFDICSDFDSRIAAVEDDELLHHLPAAGDIVRIEDDRNAETSQQSASDMENDAESDDASVIVEDVIVREVSVEEVSEEEELPPTFCYGEPLEDVAGYVAKRNAKKGEDSKQTQDITIYRSTSKLGLLHCNPEGYARRIDPADEDREDPRSEGSLLHAVMENVIVEEDLERGLQLQRARGRMTREDCRRYEPLLRGAMLAVRDRGWFTGRYRVLTERPVLTSDPVMRRPDRVMLSDEGLGIVVDYKFGNSTDNASEHRKQVRRYMRLLRATGRCSRVEGYLWYINESLLLPVATEE